MSRGACLGMFLGMFLGTSFLSFLFISFHFFHFYALGFRFLLRLLISTAVGQLEADIL